VIHSSFDAGTDPALKMRQPTTYVKAAAQRFAFKKIPAPPLWSSYSGVFYLLHTNSIRIFYQLPSPSKPAKLFPSISLPFAWLPGELIAMQEVNCGIKM
jgi:hypothetical protein